MTGKRIASWRILFLVATVTVLVASACAPTPQVVEKIVTQEVEVEKVVTATPEPMVEESRKVYALFSTPVEEPWVAVIHDALQKVEDEGRIEYEYVDELGYAGDLERVMRETLEREDPFILFGESFGNEEAARRVAAEYPDNPIVFGSGLGPAEPNYAVFDNWIHEPAYLCGLIAGGMTESNIIGVVGGYPVPEVNRIVNAFIDGVAETNPGAEVRVVFLNSWFDPPAAKEQALALIDAGADVMYAERFGVIDAAVERDVWAFGMMTDQHELGPEHVLTGPVWNMYPTVDYIVGQVEADSFVSQDLKDFTMMAKGGAMLAPYHGMDQHIPQEILDLVAQREQEIKQGLFRVNVDEAQPEGSQ